MINWWTLLLLSFGYVSFLFAIAHWGDNLEQRVGTTLARGTRRGPGLTETTALRASALNLDRHPLVYRLDIGHHSTCRVGGGIEVGDGSAGDTRCVVA